MQRRLLSMLLFAAASATSLPIQAQIWFDTAAIMQPVVLNPCPSGQCPGVGSSGDTEEAADAQNLSSDAAGSPTVSVDLAYSPSAQRRRINLAEFVAKTRADNPESATRMEELFAVTDVIEQVGSALAPYGYSVANVGDAYAFWWMTRGKEPEVRTAPSARAKCRLFRCRPITRSPALHRSLKQPTRRSNNWLKPCGSRHP